MIQAYNFLASWQLFPEKGTYEWGDRPLSGLYKISAPEGRKELQIEQNWVNLEHQAFWHQLYPGSLTRSAALYTP